MNNLSRSILTLVHPPDLLHPDSIRLRIRLVRQSKLPDRLFRQRTPRTLRQQCHLRSELHPRLEPVRRVSLLIDSDVIRAHAEDALPVRGVDERGAGEAGVDLNAEVFRY